MQLKIGTYNICHCANFEDRKVQDKTIVPQVNVDKTANVIKALNLDVIGLNEVYEVGEQPECVAQTSRLAKLCGYEYSVFAMGEEFSWCTIGNAVLSRYPIISSKSIVVEKPPVDQRVPKDSWWEDRVILVVDVNVQGERIRVLCTHFGLTEIERKNIVDKVLEIIDDSDCPTILMGDFNVQPDNKILESIYDRLDSVAKKTSNTAFTFSTYQPTEQIDYIFVPKTARIQSCEVQKFNVSDHFPLTAEITL